MKVRTFDRTSQDGTVQGGADAEPPTHARQRPPATSPTTHPAYRAPEQLAALFKHATLHVAHEPDEQFEQVWGEASALYEALGYRLGEPGHEGTDGW